MAESLWNSISGQEFVAKRAYRDSDGNIITATYATKAELSALDATVSDKVDTADFEDALGDINDEFDRVDGELALKQDASAMTAYQPVGDYMPADALDGVSATWNTVTDKLDVTAYEASAANFVTDDELVTALAGKVDVEPGKGLSTNDFTDEAKDKLDGIEEGAQANVQADWSVTNSASDAYIANKPDIYTKDEVDTLLDGKVVILAELPATGKPGVVYYIGPVPGVQGDDKYDEYIWNTDSWLKVGEHSISLSGYATEAYVDNKVDELSQAVAEDIVELQNTKLDTTAFSDVSATFLTAHQSLEDYLTKEDAAATYQPVGDYMDAGALDTVSARWEDTADIVEQGKDTWDTVTAKASTEDLTAAVTELEGEISAVSAAVDTKADKADLDNAVANIDDKFDAVADVIADVSGAIGTVSAVVDDIAADMVSKELFTETVGLLQTDIDSKADIAELESVSGELADDINTVSAAVNGKQDTLVFDGEYDPVDNKAATVATVTGVAADKLDTTAFSTVSGKFVSADTPNFTATLAGLAELTISSDIGYTDKSVIKVVDKSKLVLEADTDVSSYNTTFVAGMSNSAAFSGNFAQGQNNIATGGFSFTQGLSNSADTQSMAQGLNNKAKDYSLAQGNSNTAIDKSFAQGTNNSASYKSLAQGENNSASVYAQAIGRGNVMTNTGMAIGQFNKTSSDASFVIGNGTSNADRSDLFVIKHDGTVSATGDIVTDGKSLSSVYDTVNTYSAGWDDVADKVDTTAFEAATGTLAGAIDTVSAATVVNAEDIATLGEKANELESDIDAISAVIPSDATEQNKLVSTDTLDAKIADFGGFKIATGTGADQHPDVQNPDTKFIYLVKDDSVSGDDKFKEWIYDNGWKLVGDTSMDLSNYVQLPDTHTDRNIVVFGPNDDILDGGRKLSDIDDAIDAVSADAREEFDGIYDTFKDVETALDTKQDVSAMTGYYTIDNPAGYITNTDIAGKVDTSAFNNEIDRVDDDIDFLSAAIDDIPAQVQSDWTEEDPDDPAFILNKPEDLDLSAGDYMNITETGNSLEFSVDYPTLSAQVAENLVHTAVFTIKV